VAQLYPRALGSLSTRSRERERERERKKVEGVLVRYTTIVGKGVVNNIFGLKVPRHCPLVLY
jgi:hypothetical protein